MNVLIIGSGKGSWQIRGVQLGAAIGARVRTEPTKADVEWADRVVLVKRALKTWGLQVRRWTKAPIVWDAVDFWAQPSQNGLDRDAAIAMANDYMRQVSPELVIGATQAMADDLGGVYVPHHANPAIKAKPVRASVQTVAYEGGEVYLGRWRKWISDECAKRGWRFVLNPPSIADADLLVAFRDGDRDGWICREWKSGVKHVNAMAAERPFITQESAAWLEVMPYATIVEHGEKLGDAFDRCAPMMVRVETAHVLRSRSERYRLSHVADQYREVLEDVACPA